MADRIAIMEAGTIVQLGPPEDVYNRPASPFVAAFMGADNVIALEVRRAEDALVVEAGAHNEAARLPFGSRPGEDGVHIEDTRDGLTQAHFRSKAARLVDACEQSPDSLVLRGRISQSWYPGGFWRYAVEVGEQPSWSTTRTASRPARRSTFACRRRRSTSIDERRPGRR